MTTPPPPDALAAAGAELARVRHDPTYLTAHRVSWARCSCGWSSLQHPTTGSAAIDFAHHLAAQPLARTRAEQTAEHDTNGASDE